MSIVENIGSAGFIYPIRYISTRFFTFYTRKGKGSHDIFVGKQIKMWKTSFKRQEVIQGKTCWKETI
jgi:hypothetical protein